MNLVNENFTSYTDRDDFCTLVKVNYLLHRTRLSRDGLIHRVQRLLIPDSLRYLSLLFGLMSITNYSIPHPCRVSYSL